MSKHKIRNKNIIFLWIGHLISHSGDAVYAIALPWLMLEMTGSKIQTALVSSSAYMPALLFGLFAGAIIDRYNRKRIMIVSDVMRFFLVMIIPLAITFNFFSPLLIGFVTFLMAIFSTLFYPARDCLIPHLVTEKDLPAANSSMVVSGQISHLLGPLFAALGLSFIGLTHLFTVDAISFLVSIIMISFVINPEKRDVKRKKQSQMASIKEGFNYLKQNKGIVMLLFITFINNLFIMGPAFIGLAVFVREILKEDIIVFAYLETFMAFGMILGSFIFSFLLKHISLIYMFFLGILIDGLTFSFLYFVNNNFLTMFILFLHGIGIPLIMLSRTTLIHKIVPNLFRGRLFSMVHMAVMGTTAISIGITGLVLEYFKVNFLFLVIGVCASSCIFIGFFSKNFLSLEQDFN